MNFVTIHFTLKFMIVHDFSNENSVLNQFISELRAVSIQKDTMRFRKNIERVGQVLCYEFSKTLAYNTRLIKTPLGKKKMGLTVDNLVLCSVLRAGLPLHQGVLSFFDKSENAFISAYRKHKENDDDFEVVVEYLAAPALDGKILVLIDPMLATGKTLHNVLKAFKNHGIPKQIHILSVIGSQLGVDYISKVFPENSHLWIAAIDENLSIESDIIPGLGDAGDLAFGLKL